MVVVNTNGRRNRGGWTEKSYAYMDRVKAVLDSMRQYWPLTLRQVYYQLVSAGHIENNASEYQKLSRILVKARLDEMIPWESMEDRHREVLESGGWDDARDFTGASVDGFLTGYRRDLLQSQDVVLEVWIELDALTPATLENLVRDSIEENLDLSLFQEEQERQAEERGQILDLRGRIIEVVDTFGLDDGS